MQVIFVMMGDRMTIRCNAKGKLGFLTGSGKGSKQLAVAGWTFIELLIVIGIICVILKIADMAFESYILRGRNDAAMADVRVLDSQINSYRADWGVFPNDLSVIPSGNKLDPWGHPYQYLNIANNANWHGQCRRDRHLNPINTDFDLYSMGADGRTQKPLTAHDSHDDIVRANNGSFVGLADNF
jgi:general secretion pathway protein G